MLKSFFDQLFSRMDETEELLMQQFGFLVDVYGFQYCKTDLGNYVDENGKLLFYGPYFAFSFYNDSFSLNILYLEQRKEYRITITESYCSEQAYIHHGIPVPEQYAEHLEEFSSELKNALETGVGIPVGEYKQAGYRLKNGRLVVPEGTEEIQYRDINPLLSTTGMQRVLLPSSLKRIGPRSFFDLPELKEINLPSGLLEIGHEAFWGCDSLERLSVPASVQQIGYSAFCNCTRLHLAICGRSQAPAAWGSDFAANVSQISYQSDKVPGGEV